MVSKGAAGRSLRWLLLKESTRLSLEIWYPYQSRSWWIVILPSTRAARVASWNTPLNLSLKMVESIRSKTTLTGVVGANVMLTK